VLPRARICEIFGPESSRETALCLNVIAEAQRQGGNVVFIDVEHALDPKYMRTLGVDFDNLMVLPKYQLIERLEGNQETASRSVAKATWETKQYDIFSPSPQVQCE
jgi:RecA/RadA recombinase